ncbi:MAG: FliG C-terminal domain-containing protein [Candidatus Marinimicrobia bacterium]|nr:FliG C-terminal domain-containing protein [Candidatus Neomarinimicrobiota bacterium]
MADQIKLAGIDKAAILFDILGARLAGQLFPNLNDEEIVAVRQHASKVKETPFEAKKQVLEEFYFSFMSKKFAAESKEATSQPFAFLENMSEVQLAYLTRSEPTRSISILLAQVPLEMQRRLLQRLPTEVRTEAMIDLGKIKDVPLEAVLDVAAEFREKAKQIPSHSEYSEGGGKAMAGLLGTMEIKEQKQFLDYLSQEDPELAREVKKHHFTFDNVPVLPDSVLRDIFNSLDLDDVALALKGQDQELSDRILENLPQKKQAMYEPKEGPVSRKQVEAAQKKVVEFILQMDADPANEFSIEEFAEADFIE